MLNPELSNEYFTFLDGWNVNLVRYPLKNVFSPQNTWTPQQFIDWMNYVLQMLSVFLPQFAIRNIGVIIDLHDFPRDVVGAHKCHKMIHHREFEDAFITGWENAAKLFKGNTTIFGFDLLNEPRLADEDHDTWEAIATRTIERIRSHDASRTVVFEPKNAAPGWFGRLRRLPFRNVLYSPHVYAPQAYTHQETDNYPVVGRLSYPDPRRGIDKAYLRAVLEPVREFAVRNDAGIYVGEFSFTQFSPVPSAYNYLLDVIELFEEWNWRWTYHAFRENPVWSVQSGRDNGMSEALLRSYFARNRF